MKHDCYRDRTTNIDLNTTSVQLSLSVTFTELGKEHISGVILGSLTIRREETLIE